MRFLVIGLFVFSSTMFCFAFGANAQHKDSIVSNKKGGKGAFDEPPTFPGGASKYAQFLKNNIKYPKAASVAKAEGIVEIQVGMDKKGKIISTAVYKDPVGYGCAEEAIRVINLMPAWSPAKRKGKPVSCKLNFPIKFSMPKK